MACPCTKNDSCTCQTTNQCKCGTDCACKDCKAMHKQNCACKGSGQGCSCQGECKC